MTPVAASALMAARNGASSYSCSTRGGSVVSVVSRRTSLP
jgi:hypothetical protein